MIKSFCKINLSLKVLKKLKIGLHDIQSNTMLLNLHDTLKVKKFHGKKDIIIFKGNFKKMVNKSKNSVSDTIRILRKKNLIKKENKYKIIVNKKIPVFSGLGGGTSNAAFLIKHLTKNKIKSSKLKIFEKQIGSDFKLFFYKQLFQKNLKKIIKYKKNFNFNFVLVYPNIQCSTKTIYSKVKKYSDSSETDFSKIISKDKFVDSIRKETNDLQKIVTSEFFILKRLLNFISIQQGCYFSRMTGSGSVCFGIFKSRKLAILGMKKIKKKFPRYWCMFAKTI